MSVACFIKVLTTFVMHVLVGSVGVTIVLSMCMTIAMAVSTYVTVAVVVVAVVRTGVFVGLVVGSITASFLLLHCASDRALVCCSCLDAVALQY